MGLSKSNVSSALRRFEGCSCNSASTNLLVAIERADVSPLDPSDVFINHRACVAQPLPNYMEVAAAFIDSGGAVTSTIEKANVHLMPNFKLNLRVVECSIGEAASVHEKLHSNVSIHHWLAEGIHTSASNDRAEEQEDVSSLLAVQLLHKFKEGRHVVAVVAAAVVAVDAAIAEIVSKHHGLFVWVCFNRSISIIAPVTTTLPSCCLMHLQQHFLPTILLPLAGEHRSATPIFAAQRVLIEFAGCKFLFPVSTFARVCAILRETLPMQQARVLLHDKH